MIETVDQLDAYYPVPFELMSTQFRNLLSVQSIITHVDGSDEFQSIFANNSKHQYIITPQELNSSLCIGLKTADCTLKATTHHYIQTTGFLTKRFGTNKLHLCYKNLS